MQLQEHRPDKKSNPCSNQKSNQCCEIDVFSSLWRMFFSDSLRAVAASGQLFENER